MVDTHATIQKAVIQFIGGPDFEAVLPTLSDARWAKLLATSKDALAENERLEFLGDALMYATIGRMLFEHIPDGSPHLYTVLRAVLHSNATFSSIAERVDILAVNNAVMEALNQKHFGDGANASQIACKSRSEVKKVNKKMGDLFEVVMGAYYLDNGFDALTEWVMEIYMPIIPVANASFEECFKQPKSAPSKKRAREPDDSQDTLLLEVPKKKIKLKRKQKASSAAKLRPRPPAGCRGGGSLKSASASVSQPDVSGRLAELALDSPLCHFAQPDTAFLDLTFSSDSSDEAYVPRRHRDLSDVNQEQPISYSPPVHEGDTRVGWASNAATATSESVA